MNKILIFPHIPKTAGTSLVSSISNHLKKDEILILDYKNLSINPDSGKRINYQKIVFKYLNLIPEEKREKIKFLTGHAVPFGVHKYFNKDAIYMTFVREPFSRTESLYNYFRFLHEKEHFWAKKKELYKNTLFVNGKVPDFLTWVKAKFGDILKPFSLGTQSDYLDVLGYKISDFDHIGTTDELKFLKKENVSKKYVLELTENERKILKSKLKNDFSLYNKVCGIYKKGTFRNFLGRSIKAL